MKEKICPMMAQGWIAGYMSNFFNENINSEEAVKKLPKCLEENCALWIGYNSKDAGHCGLKE